MSSIVLIKKFLTLRFHFYFFFISNFNFHIIPVQQWQNYATCQNLAWKNKKNEREHAQKLNLSLLTFEILPQL
jgi:hypothetical protein